MKKILMFSTALIISLALMGCGSGKDKEVKDNDATTNKDTENNLIEENDGDVNDGDVVDEETGTNENMSNSNDSRLDVAEDAADRVVELDEVDSATVIVTNRNAYTAVVLNNKDTTDTNANADESLSADLEDKIAKKVKEADKEIDKVYVSLNPDFVERMSNYRTKINEGKPVEGFFEEFTESVRNVFPDSR